MKMATRRLGRERVIIGLAPKMMQLGVKCVFYRGLVNQGRHRCIDATRQNRGNYVGDTSEYKTRNLSDSVLMLYLEWKSEYPKLSKSKREF